MDKQTAGVGPVDGSVRQAVYAKAVDLAQVKGCNGVSVWCENPAIYDADCRPPLSLVPLFDIDELWRVAARAAEIERSKVQAAVAAERERIRVLVEAVRDANGEVGDGYKITLLTSGQERAWLALLAGLKGPNP